MDADGKFGWSEPDEEVHAFVNDLYRGAGPGLAASALRAGLVDDIHQLVSPIVDGGNRFLPDGVRIELDLLDERRFANGAIFLRYATKH